MNQPFYPQPAPMSFPPQPYGWEPDPFGQPVAGGMGAGYPQPPFAQQPFGPQSFMPQQQSAAGFGQVPAAHMAVPHVPTGSAYAQAPAASAEPTLNLPVIEPGSGPRHAAPSASGFPYSTAWGAKKSRKGIVGAVCALVAVCATAGVAFAMYNSMTANQPAPAEEAAPATVKATVRADGIQVKGPQLQRGAVLSNISPAADLGEQYASTYYKGIVNGQTVYVPVAEVRLSTQPDPEAWTGIAAEDAVVYKNGDLTGSEVLTVAPGTALTVLDQAAGVYFVRTPEGFEGYIPVEKVAPEAAPEEEQPTEQPQASTSKKSTNSGSTSKKKGSGGGGSSSSGGSTQYQDQTPAPAPKPSAPSSSDGQDMVMPTAWSPATRVWHPFQVEYAYADQAANTASADAVNSSAGVGNTAAATTAPAENTGKILRSNCQSFLTILKRGDTVEVKKDSLFDFKEAPDQAASSNTSTATTNTAQTTNTGADGAGVPAVDSMPENYLSAEEREAAKEQSAASGAAQADSGASATANQAQSGAGQPAGAQQANVCTIIVNGQEAQVEEQFLRLETQAPFTAWEGFAQPGMALYTDYALATPAAELAANDAIRVIDAIGNVLVVQVGDKTYYCKAETVAREQVAVAEEAAPEAATEAPAAGSGTKSSGTTPKRSGGNSGGSAGGSGGGNSGGSAPTPSQPAPTPAPQPQKPSQEWTDTTM